MNKLTMCTLLALAALPACAQQMLSLDTCRAMALRNNKQLGIAKLKQDVARDVRKAARTKYLPHVDVLGGYELTSKEISILNNSQKNALAGLGTNTVGQVGNAMNAAVADLVKNGLLSPEFAGALSNLSGKIAPALEQAGNAVGNSIKDAFRTNTRNIFTASVVVTQPVFMGGAITAANKMADIGEQMAATDIQNSSQNTIYSIDNAYWMVVSLKHKEKLANSYLTLVKKLDTDVKKMIKEGVATRADGLKVSVKVNEAEMQLTQVENGVSLAKMLLCQLCGMPVSDQVTLQDENDETIVAVKEDLHANVDEAKENRPELRLLKQAVELSEQSTRLVRSAYLPQVAVTAGYLMSNPNLYNGFERKFSGMWNIGILVRVPVWNWFEGTYKVRASKIATQIARMEYDDAGEKVELQVNQSSYKVAEANKKLAMATKNTESADENLRCANLGFKEGVMDVTDVMAAQTAWMQAQTQKIDAEIDVKLSQINLKKVVGELIY